MAQTTVTKTLLRHQSSRPQVVEYQEDTLKRARAMRVSEGIQSLLDETSGSAEAYAKALKTSMLSHSSVTEVVLAVGDESEVLVVDNEDTRTLGEALDSLKARLGKEEDAEEPTMEIASAQLERGGEHSIGREEEVHAG